MDVDDLAARVATAFDRLGLPAWPNPHPDGATPRDDEYSRVTDPARYTIVHARARVWAAELGALAGVRVEDLDQGGTRVTPATPGALPLLLIEHETRSAESAPLAVLHVAVARPDVTVAVLPDCGCDACDWGSDDLLTAVDNAVRQVIGGPYAALRGRGWQADWHPEGGSSGGIGVDHARAVDLCRRLAAGENVRLPRGTEAFVGRPWFG